MLMCAAGHDILYNWSVGGWAPHQDKLRIRIKKHANYQFFQYSLKIWERKNFGKLSRSLMYSIVYAGIEHSDASPINFRYDDIGNPMWSLSIGHPCLNIRIEELKRKIIRQTQLTGALKPLLVKPSKAASILAQPNNRLAVKN